MSITLASSLIGLGLYLGTLLDVSGVLVEVASLLIRRCGSARPSATRVRSQRR